MPCSREIIINHACARCGSEYEWAREVLPGIRVLRALSAARHGCASGARAMGRAASHAATAEPATATQAAMNASR